MEEINCDGELPVGYFPSDTADKSSFSAMVVGIASLWTMKKMVFGPACDMHQMIIGGLLIVKHFLPDFLGDYPLPFGRGEIIKQCLLFLL